MCYDLVKDYKPNDSNETFFDHLFSASEVDMEIDDSVDHLANYDFYVSSISKVDTYKFELGYCRRLFCLEVLNSIF